MSSPPHVVVVRIHRVDVRVVPPGHHSLLDVLVAPIQEPVAVTEFVPAARVVLASPTLEVDIAGVGGDQTEVVSGEVARGAGDCLRQDHLVCHETIISLRGRLVKASSDDVLALLAYEE